MCAVGADTQWGDNLHAAGLHYLCALRNGGTIEGLREGKTLPRTLSCGSLAVALRKT